MISTRTLAAALLLAGSISLTAAEPTRPTCPAQSCEAPCCPQAAAWLAATWQPEAQVTLGLRYITVDNEFFERFGLDCDLGCAKPCGECPKSFSYSGAQGVLRIGVDLDCADCCKTAKCCESIKTVGLTDKQVHLLLEAIQGDPRTCVTSAPRLTVLNGQTATVSTQDQQNFVTGFHISVVNGQQVVVPEQSTVTTGMKTNVKATISADHKFVALDLKSEYSYLPGGDVPLFPVTTTVTPKFEGGFTGQPIPFTQFIQQPKHKTVSLDTRLNIATGKTMLVYCGKVERIARVETRVPVVSKIPYLNRLFKTVSNVPTTEHLLVMVTPQVIVSDCETANAACCPKACLPPVCEATVSVPVKPIAKAVKSAVEQRAEKMATKLVTKYHEACGSGDAEKARKYARQALDLDPTCFAKPTTVPATIRPRPVPTMIAPTTQAWPPPQVFRGPVIPCPVMPQMVPPPAPMFPPTPPVQVFQPAMPPVSFGTVMLPPVQVAVPAPPETPTRVRLIDRLGNILSFRRSCVRAEITLPSAHYLEPRPQYFRPDPDFPLEHELATQQGRIGLNANIPAQKPGNPVPPQTQVPYSTGLVPVAGQVLPGFKPMAPPQPPQAAERSVGEPSDAGVPGSGDKR